MAEETEVTRVIQEKLWFLGEDGFVIISQNKAGKVSVLLEIKPESAETKNDETADEETAKLKKEGRVAAGQEIDQNFLSQTLLATEVVWHDGEKGLYRSYALKESGSVVVRISERTDLPANTDDERKLEVIIRKNSSH